MSWLMIVFVSSPEASPEMFWVAEVAISRNASLPGSRRPAASQAWRRSLALERGPRRNRERVRRRDRADHVPVEVAHLHDHAAVLRGLEVQLALLRAQLL